jgi:hypothetical protein
MEVKHEAINTKLIRTILKDLTIPNTEDDDSSWKPNFR